MQTWTSLLVQQEIEKCRGKSQKCRESVNSRYKNKQSPNEEHVRTYNERSTNVERTNYEQPTNILTKNLTKCSDNYKQDVIAAPVPDAQTIRLSKQSRRRPDLGAVFVVP